VFQRFEPVVDNGFQVTAGLLAGLPARLREEQAAFARTGGLHACAIFDEHCRMMVLREDVGRHNALDKVLGWALQRGLLPFDRHVLLLSGRVSFEMMQKALAAGVPVVAAISAPTSLAVEFAEGGGQTLVGFLRGGTMNVYCHPGRVKA
jgi:FdhD protein